MYIMADVDGKPEVGGTAIGDDSVSAWHLPSDGPDWFSFYPTSVSGVNLSPGKYWICLSNGGVPTPTTWIKWVGQSWNPYGDAADTKADWGTTPHWSGYFGLDLFFQVFGERRRSTAGSIFRLPYTTRPTRLSSVTTA